MKNDGKTSKITEARLSRAMRTVATIIDHYGDAYWPIFEALETQLEARITNSARLAQFSRRRRLQRATKPGSTPAIGQHGMSSAPKDRLMSRETQ
ncbi:MAG: hypothetical protein JKY25_02620 [Robiginitomaculum sp.]|nr:hypothetical protein [Robiginitomaculum sp.]